MPKNFTKCCTRLLAGNYEMRNSCSLLVFMRQKFTQQPRQFKWFAWLPYPISWLRALFLVPIAFPVARLIVLGFTGTVMSAIGNIPVVLVFCLVFGLFLPTIALSFPYHFFCLFGSIHSQSKIISGCLIQIVYGKLSVPQL